MAKPQRTVQLLLGVFGGIGAILLAISVYLGVAAWRFTAAAARAEGVVTDLIWSRGSKGGKTATPLVRFQAEGRQVEIQGAFSSSPPGYEVGEKVTVLYPPGRPEEGRIEGFWQQYFAAVLLGGMGFTFGGIPGGIALAIARARRRRERALAFGQSVRAKVTAVRQDTSVKVNRQSPFVIEAEAKTASGAPPLAFTSHRLWTDPSEQYPVGGEVTVYYLPEEPSCYAFKLDKLPDEEG